MTAASYRIVFRGEIAPGQELPAVKARLATLTKLDAPRIEQLFSAGETVLKAGLERATAERYLAALQATGAVCHLQPQQAAAPAQPPKQPAAPQRQMSCPKCGHNQPVGESCAACGVIYAKFHQQASPAAPALPFAPPGEPAGTPPPLALILLALVLVGAALWWLNFPRAGAVPEGAYLNQKGQFAVQPPSDWLMITPENYQTIVSQYRDRIPRELSQLIGRGKPGFAVSYLKLTGSETEFSPTFNIVVVDTKGHNMPRLTEEEKEKGTQAVAAELGRQINGYKLDKSTIVPVDGLDSLQIRGGAEISVVTKPSQPIYSQPSAFGWRRVTGHTEEEKISYKLSAIQTMIPGNKRAYVLSFMYDEAKNPEMALLHQQVLDSFRVLEHPPRFGGILMGALNGGLIGATLYLLGLLVGRGVRRQQGLALVLLMLLCQYAAGCSKASPPGKPTTPAAPSTAKGTAGGETTAIELTPSPQGFPMGLSTSQGFALHLFDTPNASQGFKKMPPDNGFKRHYDEFTLAGKSHLVITEESSPPRFYFDENRNGDLTDDRPPSEGEKAGLLPNHYAIQVLYEDEKVVVPYRMWMFGSNMGGVRFYPACHWHGSLTVKGVAYKVVAFDGNSDGDYSNDPLVIDVNGNDKADEDETLTPGKSLVIDGQQVTLVSVSPSGLTVRLRM